jgi:hypothetical protein
MKISGPVPDWIDDVMRAWMSLALMVSTSSLIPVAFWHSSVISPLSSWSEAGTKSAQRSQCTVLACAKAGARPVARMVARPPVLAAMAPAPDSFRILRRVMRAMFPPVCGCAAQSRVLGRALARAEASNRGLHGQSVQPSAPGCDARTEYAHSVQTASAIPGGFAI